MAGKRSGERRKVAGSPARRLDPGPGSESDPPAPPARAGAAGRAGRRLWAFGFILLVAAGLRLYAVQTANLWLDEYLTLELSSGNGLAHEQLPVGVLIATPPNPTSLRTARPPWAIWTSLGEVTHPPLFFLLLRFWREALGPGDIAARLLPCLASLIAIVLLYRVACALHGPGPALWAAALMAVAGQQIYHAQEIRGYSLLLVWGLGALAALVAIEQEGPSPGRAAALFGCTLAMLLTHYFTVGAVAALGLYAVLRLRHDARAWAMGALACAGVGFAVAWGPFMWSQRAVFSIESGAASFLADASPHPVPETLARLGLVPAHYLSPGPTTRMPLPWMATAALVASVILLRRRPGALLWCLWLGGTVGVLLALDLARHSKHLAFPRYTLLGSPAAYALMAAGTWHLKGLWRHALPAASVAACLAMLPAALGAPQGKADWQVAAAALAGSAGPGDPVVFTTEPGQVRPLYLAVSHFLDPVGRPAVLLPFPASPALLAEVRAAAGRGSGRAWVVFAWRVPPPDLLGGGRIRPVAVLENGVIVGELIAAAPGSPGGGTMTALTAPPSPSPRHTGGDVEKAGG